MNEPATPELGCVFFPVFGAILFGLMIALGAPISQAAWISAAGIVALFGTMYWS